MIKIIFLTALQSFGSGSVIGNGGDPIFEFLEAARFSTVETIKYINNDSAELAKFCKSPRITEDQSQFCRNFFKAIHLQIIELNRGPHKVKFVLREEPLLVTGPDGQPQPVAARTRLDKSSPIEFHRDSVKTMTPVQVLFLIAHEFQHKVIFQGEFISDNEPIGPFENGRELLDALARSLAEIARQQGKIGTQFGIRDILDCRVQTSGTNFGARVSSSRLFTAESLMSYKVSFGKNPTDGAIYIPETPSSELRLKIAIEEPNNCGDLTPARRTQIQIVRSTREIDGTHKEELLQDHTENRNPFCPKEDPELKISHGDLTFTCNYYGSEGTTSSPYSVRKKSKN